LYDAHLHTLTEWHASLNTHVRHTHTHAHAHLYTTKLRPK